MSRTHHYCVRPILDAGLADLVETDHRITDEVWLVPTPGHTPGHVSVMIASRGETALITGDAAHHPVQWAEPSWKMTADSNTREGEATRRQLVSHYTDEPTLIIGTHYAAPTAGHIESRIHGNIFVTQPKETKKAAGRARVGSRRRAPRPTAAGS